ncbi:hypothetical protein [Aquipuribacter hungaricus]|uniref:Flp family type IVb pilin n=1 Tax=Aquipuribacter hungaricus TaxID=545624 RepID=A0ABV7WIR2_9MICO
MKNALVQMHAATTARLSGDRGQGSLEYIGILLVIAVVVAALVTAVSGLDLGGRISTALSEMFAG